MHPTRTIKLAMHEPHNHLGRENWLSSYRKIFAELGYSVKDIAINMAAPSVEEMFGGETIDVFASDLSLGKEESYDGLELIAEVKTHFPNTLVIAQSMSSISLRRAADTIPSFDLFVSKPQLNDKKYIAYLIDQLSKKFNRNVLLTKIDCDFSRSKRLSEDSLADKIQLEDILKIITFTAHHADIKTAVHSIKLIPLIGGYSSSDVFRMEAYTSEGLKCVNAVLKVSDITTFNREINSYLNFVKWYLPYNIRPELIGTCKSKQHAAACYSFAYNDEVPFRTLTEDLKELRFDTLSLAIDLIFSPSKKRWHAQENLTEEEGLTSYYYDKWFQGKSKTEQYIDEIIRNEGSVLENGYQFDDQTYPKPSGYLLGIPKDKYIAAICHGDLNGNNILISNEHGISLIDFNRTSRGHIFDDFVTFEGSVRLSARLSGSFSEMMQYEKMLNDKSFITGESGPQEVEDEILLLSGRKPVSEAMLRLRHTAKEYSKAKNFDNYYYALALYCFRLMRMENLEEWQRQQLTACMLRAQKLAYPL